MRISAFTINSFSGIPLCTILFENIFSNYNNGIISIYHCQVGGYVKYQNSVKQIPLLKFQNNLKFSQQNKLLKVKKYLKLACKIFAYIIQNRNPVLYTIDANTCALIIFLRKIVFFRDVKLIYHQFEMDIPEHKSSLDKLSFRYLSNKGGMINLFIVPEINRLNYFTERVNIPKDNCLLFPNTTYLHKCKKNETGIITFGHIGALGDTHFFKEFLNIFSKLQFPSELLLIGRVSENIKEMIRPYKNIILIDQVEHAELGKYYHKINYGLILYKPIDLNNEFCAPNKLYEFWSYGIPVISHNLEGLKSLFEKNILGSLCDMYSEFDLGYTINRLIKENTTQRKNEIQKYFDEKLSISKYFDELDDKLKFINE